MLAAAGKNRIVTLDIPGKPWDTPQLAHELERWKQDGRDVSLLIGGPEGLSPACKAAAEQSWSLSALTLPTRSFGYWWQKACIARGALLPTTHITASSD